MEPPTAFLSGAPTLACHVLFFQHFGLSIPISHAFVARLTYRISDWSHNRIKLRLFVSTFSQWFTNPSKPHLFTQPLHGWLTAFSIDPPNVLSLLQPTLFSQHLGFVHFRNLANCEQNPSNRNKLLSSKPFTNNLSNSLLALNRFEG